MEHFVEFEEVSKYYQTGSVKIAAADHLNFYVDKGEFCIIVGPSGAGKTTLLNILGGMDSCDEGSVWLDGRNISRFTDKELTTYRRYDVGFVFQFYNLVQNLTALENVELANEISKDPLPAEQTLRQVGLEHRMDNFPAQLSGGQKRRIAIAGVIAMRPKVLILDEPTAGLDPAGCRGVLENIAAYRRETGSAVLLVTHSMDDAARIADRLIVFHDGHVAFDGTPAEVFAHTQALLDIGLDVPQSARIAQALRDRGVALPPSIYTLEQLTNALLTVGKEAGVC